MKIVSLLPSATEIVFALGLGDSLEGVSFECDFPPAARDKAVVSGTALAADLETAGAIDAAVRERLADGQPIYTLDRDRIRAIQPDLILAQDLCEVCAVPSGAVTDALDDLGCTSNVVSLDPLTLEDVIDGIGQVGAATGTEAKADELMAALHDRVANVQAAVAGLPRPRPRVLALEWADPPFSAGHWVPNMIDVAGGEALLAPPASRSRELAWADVAAAPADIVVFMPCGYHLDRATAEAKALLDQAALAGAEQLWVVDADAYFSRPGPRVVDGAELLAAILHPVRVGAPDPDQAVRLR
jgi:iron complex transport system substrate-binding protein